MRSDWVRAKIEDICSHQKGAIAIGPFGSRLKSDNYVESGVPVIRGTNITGGPNFEGEFVYITEEKAAELGSANVYKNDLVFPHRGAIGEVGIVLDDAHYVLSSSLMKLSCDLSKANPKFLYYFFKSSFGKHELLKNASQVGTPGIGQPLTSLKNIEVLFPPIKKQDKIASILFDFDKKIELNRKINQTLEAMAQALFKSWFVDFEPVKAKVAAKAAGADAEGMTLAAMEALSGQNAEALAKMAQTEPDRYAELKATAELFPDALVDSELGEIPAGWEVKPLKDILELAYGKALKKTERTEGPYPVYGSGGVTGTHNEYLVKGPGIIVGRKGTVGSLYFEHEPFFPIDTVFYVKPLPDYSLSYCYYLLQTLGLEKMNTDAAVPGLNRNNAYRLLCVSAPQKVHTYFQKLIDKLLDTQRNNIEQVNDLIALRDTLLPKLLSGEVSVENIAEATIA